MQFYSIDGENMGLKTSQFNHLVETDDGNAVLFNALTKHVLPLRESDKLIAQGLLRTPDQQLGKDSVGWKEILFRCGFLVDGERNEVGELETAYWNEKKNSNALNIGVVLTQQCNLRCVYCNQEHISKNISEDDEQRIVKFVEKQSPRFNSLNLTWWGGEPLIRLKTIESLTNSFQDTVEAHRLHYSAFTSTNATLIDSEVAEQLVKLRFEHFQISIDGPAELHDQQRPSVTGGGTYHAVLRGVRSLFEAFGGRSGLVTLRIHVAKSSLTSTLAWRAFFEDIRPFQSALKLHITRVHETFRYEQSDTLTQDELLERFGDVVQLAVDMGFVLTEDSLLERKTLMYCGAVQDDSWFVLPGSYVTRCNNSFNDPKDYCGQITASGEIEFYKEAERWLRLSPFDHNECLDCDVLPLCMGGCAIVPFDHPSAARCHIRKGIKKAIRSDPRNPFEKSCNDCPSNSSNGPLYEPSLVQLTY